MVTMMRRHPKSIKAAAAIMALGLASLCIASLTLRSSANDRNVNVEEQHTTRRLSSAPPPPGNDATPFDPNEYAYLIIHYHKTGHHLSHSLRDFLALAGKPAGGPVSSDKENSFLHRNHEERTGCPKAMSLTPGVIYVQAAPNFFCDTNVLVESLLRNDDFFKEKKGVKIIHLVRNPFALAVSNWVYHAQYPTPELWVKSIDPCAEELWYGSQSLEELVRPTLMLGDGPTVRRGDFGSLRRVCTGLYRTGKGSRSPNPDDDPRKWSFYTHLRHLDPESALALATTHMMIQGKSGGDILRMASNIVKLKQLQQLEDQIRLSQHIVVPPNSTGGTRRQDRMVQVLTMSMEEFTRSPREATLRFLDFALGDASPPAVKKKIAREYEQSYYKKVKGGDEHITNDKVIKNGLQENIVDMKGRLEEYLRTDELFGRILGNVELLVQDALGQEMLETS